MELTFYGCFFVCSTSTYLPIYYGPVRGLIQWSLAANVNLAAYVFPGSHVLLSLQLKIFEFPNFPISLMSVTRDNGIPQFAQNLIIQFVHRTNEKGQHGTLLSVFVCVYEYVQRMWLFPSIIVYYFGN